MLKKIFISSFCLMMILSGGCKGKNTGNSEEVTIEKEVTKEDIKQETVNNIIKDKETQKEITDVKDVEIGKEYEIVPREDSKSNEPSTIVFVDKTPPEFSITAEDEIIKCDANYCVGIEVSDDFDKELLPSLSNVDVYSEGLYLGTFTVSDSSGNESYCGGLVQITREPLEGKQIQYFFNDKSEVLRIKSHEEIEEERKAEQEESETVEETAESE